ncbi:MAG TPA: RDD family protein [Candidatus Thermoplasmatota archaeon]|nr:RDD family protein [Candidatus Thermoplasmatota archaeon]
MQMTTEARAWLDATVRRILARHPLGGAERAGITYELMSHLHAAGEARATSLGHSEVTREDLEHALAQAGGEEQLAAAFVQPLARPVERVLFGRRLGAYAIDMVLVFIGIVLVHQALDFLLEWHMGVTVGPENAAAEGELDGTIWFPWGFHDPSLSLPLQGVFALASGAVLLGYFAWTEARDGRTPGKRALELQVMRTDGAPVTFREAFLRNAVKLSPPLLLLDVVVMLLAFAKDKQRVSDRIAGTIVVRA